MRAYTVVVLCLAVFRVEASDRVFRYAEGMRGATLPFYMPGESKPYAALRVQRVVKDFDRRGFFRIGLLPVLVADSVTLRILQPSRAPATIAAADELTKTAANVVEWRNVELFYSDERIPRLRAARMRPSPKAGWEVWDATVLRGTNQVQCRYGRLSVERDQLVFSQSGGRHAVNISANHN